jgi:hypothetical protein
VAWAWRHRVREQQHGRPFGWRARRGRSVPARTSSVRPCMHQRNPSTALSREFDFIFSLLPADPSRSAADPAAHAPAAAIGQRSATVGLQRAGGLCTAAIAGHSCARAHHTVHHTTMDTLLAAVEAHGTGAPPAPSPATSSSAVVALSGGHAGDASVAPIDGAARQSPSMPRQIEIPSSLGRAPTYMNAVLGERGAALQEATGWTLGTSISREVAGVQEKVLKTKWRVANAATGPIVVGFATRQGTLVYIQYDDTLSTPFSTVKIQTRLPAGRGTSPPMCPAAGPDLPAADGSPLQHPAATCSGALACRATCASA